MQAPTHVLAGVLIQKTFGNIASKPLRIFLIAVTGLFLHSVFDRIARLTYHPPDPDFKNALWVGYHIIVLLGFIASLYYFWEPYKLGIIFSILPDFDWVIKHGSNALGVSSGFYDRPWIHESIHWFVDRIPPFAWLQHLPNLTHLPAAALFEVFIVAILLFVIINEPFPWSEEDVEAEMEEEAHEA